MPEVFFLVRWPDGSRERCYSPSLVVEDFFAAGTTYDVSDFLVRSRQALSEASDRVRAKYGFGCAQAENQLRRIEERAGAFDAGARVSVDGFERC
jgi:uncharacterized repeat protein (TIGR04042 family)